MFSNKLSIKKTDKSGLGVVAIEKIEKNEILIVEESQALVPIFTEEEFIFYCCNCFNKIKNKMQFFACQNCSLFVYCDSNCAKQNWNNHKIQCGYSQLLQSAGISYLVTSLS